MTRMLTLVSGEMGNVSTLIENGFKEEHCDVLYEGGYLQYCGKKKYTSAFCGAVVTRNTILYILPRHYRYNYHTVDDGQFIIEVFQKYLSDSAPRAAKSQHLNEMSILMRTYNILNGYFLKFGLYMENANVYDYSKNGSINWSKTISKNEAIFSEVHGLGAASAYSVLYPRPVVSLKQDQHGLISHLFKTILQVLATFISPLKRRRHPLESRVPVSELVDQLKRITTIRKSYYLDLLRFHVARESGGRRRVIEAMYAFIKLDSDAISHLVGNECFAFGTFDFENVWEAACRGVVGATHGRGFLAQPSFRASPGAALNVSLGSQRVDGVVQTSEKSLIIDAKYYNTDDIRISAYDVMKQYGYCISSKNPQATLNALIMPSKKMTTETVGHITLCHIGQNEPCAPDIRVVCADANAVLTAYLNKSIYQELLMEVLGLSDVSEELDSVNKDLVATNRVFRVSLSIRENSVKILAGSILPRPDKNSVYRLLNLSEVAGKVGSAILRYPVSGVRAVNAVGRTNKGKFTFDQDYTLECSEQEARDAVKVLMTTIKQGRVGKLEWSDSAIRT